MRIRRTTARARVSSRTSGSFRPTSRLTTASAIRPATSSRRGMPEETGYTASREGVKHNYPENRSKVAIYLGQEQAEAGALAGEAVHLDPTAMRLGQGLHQAEPEPKPARGGRVGMGHAHVLVEDPGELLGRDRLDAREIQQRADDAAEGARLGVEVDEAAVRLLGRQRGAEQQLAEPLERGQRRSQLVGDHREKLGLGLVELPQPARRRLDLFRELLREALLAQRESRVLHRQADVHRELLGGRAAGAR